MLKINDRFTIDIDTCNVIVKETSEGKDRFGQPKVVVKKSYHSSMLQACNVIIYRSAEGKTVEDVVDAINAAKRDIQNAIKEG